MRPSGQESPTFRCQSCQTHLDSSSNGMRCPACPSSSSSKEGPSAVRVEGEGRDDPSRSLEEASSEDHQSGASASVEGRRVLFGGGVEGVVVEERRRWYHDWREVPVSEMELLKRENGGRTPRFPVERPSFEMIVRFPSPNSLQGSSPELQEVETGGREGEALGGVRDGVETGGREGEALGEVRDGVETGGREGRGVEALGEVRDGVETGGREGRGMEALGEVRDGMETRGREREAGSSGGSEIGSASGVEDERASSGSGEDRCRHEASPGTPLSLRGHIYPPASGGLSERGDSEQSNSISRVERERLRARGLEREGSRHTLAIPWYRVRRLSAGVFSSYPDARRELCCLILSYPQTARSDTPETSCNICQEDYRSMDKVLVLPCNHFWHTVCIAKWLGKNESCPICRQTFPGIYGDLRNSRILNQSVVDQIEPTEDESNTRLRSLGMIIGLRYSGMIIERMRDRYSGLLQVRRIPFSGVPPLRADVDHREQRGVGAGRRGGRVGASPAADNAPSSSLTLRRSPAESFIVRRGVGGERRVGAGRRGGRVGASPAADNAPSSSRTDVRGGGERRVGAGRRGGRVGASPAADNAPSSSRTDVRGGGERRVGEGARGGRVGASPAADNAPSSSRTDVRRGGGETRIAAASSRVAQRERNSLSSFFRRFNRDVPDLTHIHRTSIPKNLTQQSLSLSVPERPPERPIPPPKSSSPQTPSPPNRAPPKNRPSSTTPSLPSPIPSTPPLSPREDPSASNTICRVPERRKRQTTRPVLSLSATEARTETRTEMISNNTRQCPPSVLSSPRPREHALTGVKERTSAGILSRTPDAREVQSQPESDTECLISHPPTNLEQTALRGRSPVPPLQISDSTLPFQKTPPPEVPSASSSSLPAISASSQPSVTVPGRPEGSSGVLEIPLAGLCPSSAAGVNKGSLLTEGRQRGPDAGSSGGHGEGLHGGPVIPEQGSGRPSGAAQIESQSNACDEFEKVSQEGPEAQVGAHSGF
uniref:RING-type domain-containing protein n=1 Tax=Chromera velia CCMP2878 TaxID=1169474 RepID=A0A0G4FQB3_9ALVE|eukprot:Cvel_3614.t1-p1 / transcript=Cvel_3614.t1 / gene=Cvel_3614 / organism=Chromera_velia_CCMP2878 / gene_product=E3 ubiquitin-protein ligase RNF115, putative / transcript_product=E3 ubiquitin-protein ligase RNF115, putative / location=Cvel_scaffold148:70356-74632(-) / protein_length=999 / sequence_SO=supercontig / SO=protein_coding / is_pseudo=false